MLEEVVIFVLAAMAVVFLGSWWYSSMRLHLQVHQDDEDFYGSGLSRRQWYLIARLVYDVAWVPENEMSAFQESFEERFMRLPLSLQDSAAGRHLRCAILRQEHQELQLAAKSLVPGDGDPWIVISKSL